MNPDDPLHEVEARLRAWRPVAVPSPLLTRLLAASPRARRPPRPFWMIARVMLVMAAWHFLRHWGQEPSSSREPEESFAVRRARETAALYADWTPGADLTINLATGVSMGNAPAPWRLDGDPDVAGGLFPVRCADGKLPLKVDCQF